jgi:radical SAM superfamily enzyme YgiQ (UPF0313 family)
MQSPQDWLRPARSPVSAPRPRYFPVETKETVEQTIRSPKELDVFSIQVSLAAPYPGTELYEQARLNGWFVKQDKSDLVLVVGVARRKT